MENDAPASASSLSPISGAQSYALTDEQRLALAATDAAVATDGVIFGR